MAEQPPRPPPPVIGSANFRPVIRGHSAAPYVDVYHWLLRASWPVLFALGFASYLLVNVVFGALYLAQPGCLNGVETLTPIDAFAFSVQTFATIGYGALAPKTLYAHTLVVVESFIGMVSLALATGLVFTKFSRPSARIRFSKNIVVQDREGEPYLVLRVANERGNQVSEARATMNLLVEEVTREGQSMRRVRDLTLERDNQPLFALSWIILHKLDEKSPLFGLTAENAATRLIGIVVNISGNDEDFAQMVRARATYTPDLLVFGAGFVDMMERSADGQLTMHLDRIDATKPAALRGVTP